jgi:hypothetical protein
MHHTAGQPGQKESEWSYSGMEKQAVRFCRTRGAEGGEVAKLQYFLAQGCVGGICDAGLEHCPLSAR